MFWSLFVIIFQYCCELMPKINSSEKRKRHEESVTHYIGCNFIKKNYKWSFQKSLNRIVNVRENTLDNYISLNQFVCARFPYNFLSGLKSSRKPRLNRIHVKFNAKNAWYYHMDSKKMSLRWLIFWFSFLTILPTNLVGYERANRQNDSSWCGFASKTNANTQKQCWWNFDCNKVKSSQVKWIALIPKSVYHMMNLFTILSYKIDFCNVSLLKSFTRKSAENRHLYFWCFFLTGYNSLCLINCSIENKCLVW